MSDLSIYEIFILMILDEFRLNSLSLAVPAGEAEELQTQGGSQQHSSGRGHAGEEVRAESTESTESRSVTHDVFGLPVRPCVLLSFEGVSGGPANRPSLRGEL